MHKTSPSKFEAVPLLDLQRQYSAIREEVLTAIERVCSSQQFVLGPEVEELEKEVAFFTGSAAAVGCASGTDALWLALAAAGIKSGDAVVTTPFSFFASASSIVRAGARPVFVDIDPGTMNLNPRYLEKKLEEGNSSGIAAMLPVHLYGQCADMDELGRIAQEHQLPVIEDAAQAIGAEWNGKKAGSLGVAAAFSFYPTKNLSAYGDAGMVTTQDTDLAEHMMRLRNHGSPQRYLHTEIGWNCRMDAIQAAVLRVKLIHIQEWNGLRQKCAENYRELLMKAGLIGSNAAPIQMLEKLPKAGHVYHQFVIRARRRDELRKFLSERKIGTEVYYPLPLHLQPCFDYLGYLEGDFPEAERAAREVIALPIFPELTQEEQKWVVESVSDFYS